LYYVLQIAPGMEVRTEILIRGLLGNDLCQRCFHPMRHVRKKFRGEWRDCHEKLLPGYVFILSDSIEELYLGLKQVPMLTKMLGKDEEVFVALREEEVEWLTKLMGGYEEEGTNDGEKKESQDGTEKREQEDRVTVWERDKEAEIGLSQVMMKGDQITILSGPLKSMEGRIKKVNLHKRIAEVEVEFMGRKTILYLGIELVGKKE
jgi:transcriptional antiterminator NusG